MASIISAGTTSGTSLNLSGDTSGVLQLATNGSTTAITVDTSQNVGIGTASPGQRLDVQGASGDVRVRVKSNGGGGGGLFVADGDGAGSFPGYQTAQSGTNYWTIGQRGDTNLYMNREAGSGRVIVPTGSFQVATTIGVGGATPSTSGAGITFPATQSASTDANTLDDYEEGIWQPGIVSGMTSVTYGNRLGTYTKIGRQVNFQFVLAVTGGTRNGSLVTISLPLVSSGASTARAFGAYWTYADTNVLSSSTTNVPFLYIPENAAVLQLYNASGGSFVGTDLPSTIPSFYIAGSFITD